MMRVFIISDINSIHTKRWVKALAERGIDIFLFGFYKDLSREYALYENVQVYGCFERYKDSLFNKMRYLFVLRRLKQKIKGFEPDIVHAHYASSDGWCGALSGFHPYIVSVWGRDVYDFPNSNWLSGKILKYALKKADYTLSTSHVMAEETHKYTRKEIEVTPFGVDTELFKPMNIPKSEEFVIGNVKTLRPKYGIDVLIRAVALVIKHNPEKKIRLEIYGDGPQKEELFQLTKSLGITDKVQFKGFVQNEKLPEIYNSVSVSVSVSVLNSESFGVVAVEAMACECPVITSDADGFTEVVKDGETGLIVPKRDVEATANAIQQFIDRPKLREQMGKKGRERVLELYDWKKNVDTMVEIYNHAYNEYSSH